MFPLEPRPTPLQSGTDPLSEPSAGEGPSPWMDGERGVPFASAEIPAPLERVAVPPRQSIRQLLIHLTLFVLTGMTTTAVGTLWFYDPEQSFGEALARGGLFSFSLLTILTAHEMGHFLACRWYGVAATWPYFLPLPFPPVGTLGAFIRIQAPIPTRRALFDIGIAGPLAGFVFLVPAAWIAHHFAEPAVIEALGEGTIYFQSPLLFRFFEWLYGLPEVMLNPVMWAAWVGSLMTSLNLLPVGQLDGGHVAYALFGERGHRLVARLSYLAVLILTVVAIYEGLWNWLVWAIILTFLMRVGHPPVLDPAPPLGRGRVVIAVLGVLVFLLCFMPMPIRL
jgi:membrane-associated protease RseP (regulator of RpoE activity)